jgi:peptidoglycan biosynthesis protein MviN/MurJ (putative lipid II flippase)
MINMGMVVVFNVLANVLLIPKLNHVGASLAALLSAIFLFIIGIYWVNKIVKYDKIKIFERFLKSFFSAFVMAALIFIFKKEISFYILIPLGAIFYFSVLFLIRGFTKEEITNVYYSYINRNNLKE